MAHAADEMCGCFGDDGPDPACPECDGAGYSATAPAIDRPITTADLPY